MASIPRHTTLCGLLTSQSRILYNGKGRPGSIVRELSSRSMSTQLRSNLFNNNKRPSALRSSIAFPITSRFISSSPTKDAALNKSYAEVSEASSFVKPQPDLNAWDPNFSDVGSSGHLNSIEPHIGYLHELGLNFGWGPTSLMQWLIEHIHVYGGMPWYGTLIASAVLVRIAITPVLLGAADNAGRMSAVMPYMKKIREKVTAATLAGDTSATLMARQEMKALQKRAGLSAIRGYPAILVQFPLGFGAFRLMRNASDLPVPGLQDGGALWFVDLTARDPLFAIPLVTSVLIHLTIRKGGEAGMQTESMKPILDIMKYVFPAMSFIFTSFMPAAMTLQFCVAAFLSLCYTYVIHNPKLRALLGVYPINKPMTLPASPYKGNRTIHALDTTANQAQPEKPGVFDGAKKAMKEAKEMMPQFGQGKPAKRLNQSEQLKADDYERRRREELEEELYRRRQELRERKADERQRV